jgi:hypothetical protein
MFALINTEQLESLGQIMVKQLKNRYNDPTINKRFVIGIDRAKMKLYDLEEDAQRKVHTESKMNQSSDDEAAVFDKSKFSDEWENITPTRKKKNLTSGDIV